MSDKIGFWPFDRRVTSTVAALSNVAHFTAGYRLPSPEGTPEIVYKLMKSCWEYEADDRPHFNGIHAELEKIVKLF